MRNLLCKYLRLIKMGEAYIRGSTERLVTTAALARDTIYCYKCLHVAWYVCVSVSLLVTTHP